MDSSTDHNSPLVTVVVPAHNEEDFIVRCLASILRVDWPAGRIEILVIDHASTDKTAIRARDGGARVLTHANGKIGSVRNAGLVAASGQFVAYVDADCEVPLTWIRNAVTLLEREETVGAVGGPCLCPTRSTWVERTFAARQTTLGNRAVNAIATSSFIARRSVLLDVGLFDESLTSGEDDDISQRIRARRLTLVSSPDSHVIHYGYPRTLRAVVRKERWHGSSQLESRSTLDVTLILTHLFAVTTAALPLTLAAWALLRTAHSLAIVFATLVLELIPPLFYAAKRYSARPREAHLIPAWLAVGYAYFFGRSLGLADNYWRRFTASRSGARQRPT